MENRAILLTLVATIVATGCWAAVSFWMRGEVNWMASFIFVVLFPAAFYVGSRWARHRRR